jgi:hypothetical protein
MRRDSREINPRMKRFPRLHRCGVKNERALGQLRPVKLLPPSDTPKKKAEGQKNRHTTPIDDATGPPRDIKRNSEDGSTVHGVKETAW